MGGQPEPEVVFDRCTVHSPPFPDDIVVITYRPRATAGWALANCWHERNGIVTAVLRPCITSHGHGEGARHDADQQASDHYDL